ncbi:unnamed protein product [Rangifer tarandus platyrhynchus]|uniref:Uncharacterized protein n=1 Tax=Rangifer tarandus platyrhynchus TaxID=3082113 RepID=A0AC59YBM3_RANTA
MQRNVGVDMQPTCSSMAVHVGKRGSAPTHGKDQSPELPEAPTHPDLAARPLPGPPADHPLDQLLERPIWCLVRTKAPGRPAQAFLQPPPAVRSPGPALREGLEPLGPTARRPTGDVSGCPNSGTHQAPALMIRTCARP